MPHPPMPMRYRLLPATSKLRLAAGPSFFELVNFKGPRSSSRTPLGTYRNVGAPIVSEGAAEPMPEGNDDTGRLDMADVSTD